MRPGRTLADLAAHYGIDLTAAEKKELAGLPGIAEMPVGNVLVALEAKACMTAHQRALPRLYDELNSSHQTVHGAHDSAIAAGLVMINIADRFLSSDLNKKNRATAPEWSTHSQPKSVEITIWQGQAACRDAPRPASRIRCARHRRRRLRQRRISQVKLHTKPPAPQAQDNYHYATTDRPSAGPIRHAVRADLTSDGTAPFRRSPRIPISERLEIPARAVL